MHATCHAPSVNAPTMTNGQLRLLIPTLLCRTPLARSTPLSDVLPRISQGNIQREWSAVVDSVPPLNQPGATKLASVAHADAVHHRARPAVVALGKCDYRTHVEVVERKP